MALVVKITRGNEKFGFSHSQKISKKSFLMPFSNDQFVGVTWLLKKISNFENKLVRGDDYTLFKSEHRPPKPQSSSKPKYTSDDDISYSNKEHRSFKRKRSSKDNRHSGSSRKIRRNRIPFTAMLPLIPLNLILVQRRGISAVIFKRRMNMKTRRQENQGVQLMYHKEFLYRNVHNIRTEKRWGSYIVGEYDEKDTQMWMIPMIPCQQSIVRVIKV